LNSVIHATSIKAFAQNSQFRSWPSRRVQKNRIAICLSTEMNIAWIERDTGLALTQKFSGNYD